MGRNWKNAGPFFARGPGFPQEPPADCPYAVIEYDVFDRVGSRISPTESGTAAATFQHVGLTVAATDADGVRTTRTKDFRDRVVRIEEQGSAPLELSWDAADQLIGARYGEQASRVSYSLAGEKLALNDTVVGAWRWRHAAGRLVSQLDARGIEVKLSYDELGRPKRKEYANGEPPVVTTYDLGTNGIGHVYSIGRGAYATIYEERDEMGRELAVKERVPGSPRHEYTTAMEYLASGAISRLVYPDDYWVQYTLHPGTGLLKELVDPQGVVAEFGDYTPGGRIGYVLNRNGTSHEYTHHPITQQLRELQVADAAGGSLYRKELAYSAAGDVVGSVLEAEGVKATEVYRLVAHRLQQPGAGIRYQAGRPSSVALEGESYPLSLDANGNIVESPIFGDRVKTRAVSFNADNQPVRIRILEGRPQGSQGASAGDAGSGGGGGCVIAAAAPPFLAVPAYLKPASDATVRFEYDATGKLALARSAAAETYFIGRHFEIQNGAAVRYLFAGKLRIAMIRGNQMTFLHQDHLGSVVLTTDAGGQVRQRQGFEPFGQVSLAGAARFQDKLWEESAQLYLHGARMYDPVLRIFISADSLVADPFDPAAYERYAFARGNPLVFTDPSGHAFVIDSLLGAAVGALIGGTFAAITGGDIVKGAVTGAISGAFFGAGGGLIKAAEASGAVPLAHQVAVHVMAGVFSGGINAQVAGNHPGMGMLISGVSAGAGKFATLSVPLEWGMPGQLGAASLTGGLMGGSVSAMTGGSFGHGFALGAAQATYGYLCNYWLHRWLDDMRTIAYGVRDAAVLGVQGGSKATSQAATALSTIPEQIAEHCQVRVEIEVLQNEARDRFMLIGAKVALAHVPYLRYALPPYAGIHSKFFLVYGTAGVAIGYGIMSFGYDVNIKVHYENK